MNKKQISGAKAAVVIFPKLFGESRQLSVALRGNGQLACLSHTATPGYSPGSSPLRHGKTEEDDMGLPTFKAFTVS